MNLSFTKFYFICLFFYPKVHLEVAPDSQTLTSVDFDKLKVSNALRYQVLIEILTFLGISCDQNTTPALSPVHLLATSPVRFLLVICEISHFILHSFNYFLLRKCLNQHFSYHFMMLSTMVKSHSTG